jgi:cob(I)alamin adenosyltransferase
MPIYTRFGDNGKTSLFGGDVVEKSSLRVCAYGEIDELNAAIGIISSEIQNKEIEEKLEKIQNDLFTIGSELANRKETTTKINPKRTKEIEEEIDKMDKELEPLKNFILPGGNKVAALIHLSRTICRRTERSVVRLSNEEQIDSTIIIYLNRLSDLLFTMARYVNFKKGEKEKIWKIN